MKALKLGIAPIGWTNDDMPDLGGDISFEQCISEMSEAGYTGTEIGNKYYKDPEALRQALEDKGLRIVNCWHSTYILTMPISEVEADFRKTLSKLQYLGAKVVGVSEQSYSIQGKPLAVFMNKYYMNDAEWDKLTNGLNYLGKIALEYGIKLSYHHHMGTVVQDEREVIKLMEMTDSRYMSLLYDTGHLAYCGADYLKILKTYIDRIAHIHLKDIRPSVIEKVRDNKLSFLDGVRRGTFTVPGDGAIDFEEVVKVIADSDYSGYLLVEAEQDPKIACPKEYAKKAYNYLFNLLKEYDI